MRPTMLITGFEMLYVGFGSLEGDHVGLAHSSDGVRWEKYNDLTTDGVFERSDPVFLPVRKATLTPTAFRWGDW
jgi:hypothetical protein